MGGATAIVVVAQTTDPGTTGELLLAAAAAIGFVLSAAVARLPRAVIAALVTVLQTTAIWREGNLEVALFLRVLVTPYSTWHLGSVTKAHQDAFLAHGVGPVSLEENIRFVERFEPATKST